MKRTTSSAPDLRRLKQGNHSSKSSSRRNYRNAEATAMTDKCRTPASLAMLRAESRKRADAKNCLDDLASVGEDDDDDAPKSKVSIFSMMNPLSTRNLAGAGMDAIDAMVVKPANMISTGVMNTGLGLADAMVMKPANMITTGVKSGLSLATASAHSIKAPSKANKEAEQMTKNFFNQSNDEDSSSGFDEFGEELAASTSNANEEQDINKKSKKKENNLLDLFLADGDKKKRQDLEAKKQQDVEAKVGGQDKSKKDQQEKDGEDVRRRRSNNRRQREGSEELPTQSASFRAKREGNRGSRRMSQPASAGDSAEPRSSSFRTKRDGSRGTRRMSQDGTTTEVDKTRELPVPTSSFRTKRDATRGSRRSSQTGSSHDAKPRGGRSSTRSLDPDADSGPRKERSTRGARMLDMDSEATAEPAKPMRERSSRGARVLDIGNNDTKAEAKSRKERSTRRTSLSPAPETKPRRARSARGSRMLGLDGGSAHEPRATKRSTSRARDPERRGAEEDEGGLRRRASSRNRVPLERGASDRVPRRNRSDKHKRMSSTGADTAVDAGSGTNNSNDTTSASSFQVAGAAVANERIPRRHRSSKDKKTNPDDDEADLDDDNTNAAFAGMQRYRSTNERVPRRNRSSSSSLKRTGTTGGIDIKGGSEFGVSPGLRRSSSIESLPHIQRNNTNDSEPKFRRAGSYTKIERKLTGSSRSSIAKSNESLSGRSTSEFINEIETEMKASGGTEEPKNGGGAEHDKPERPSKAASSLDSGRDDDDRAEVEATVKGKGMTERKTATSTVSIKPLESEDTQTSAAKEGSVVFEENKKRKNRRSLSAKNLMDLLGPLAPSNIKNKLKSSGTSVASGLLTVQSAPVLETSEKVTPSELRTAADDTGIDSAIPNQRFGRKSSRGSRTKGNERERRERKAGKPTSTHSLKSDHSDRTPTKSKICDDFERPASKSELSAAPKREGNDEPPAPKEVGNDEPSAPKKDGNDELSVPSIDEDEGETHREKGDKLSSIPATISVKKVAKKTNDSGVTDHTQEVSASTADDDLLDDVTPIPTPEQLRFWKCACGEVNEKIYQVCGMCAAPQWWTCAECRFKHNKCRFLYCGSCAAVKRVLEED